MKFHNSTHRMDSDLYCLDCEKETADILSKSKKAMTESFSFIIRSPTIPEFDHLKLQLALLVIRIEELQNL